MDPRLLNYYNQELQFVRESGAEFAQEYPKIARSTRHRHVRLRRSLCGKTL